MDLKLSYRAPMACWTDTAIQDLICDSYDSGIDDYDYEDVDWTVTP